ncbi:MAG: DUF1707 domain-containing protein [Myxococcales bacterium]|nr:MAG: DUF1707 domain-containing protein [Myxococcales bacterium]
MRASHVDRDVVNEALSGAYAEGRLTPEEFDERTDSVAHARTLGELPPLLGDLVASTGKSLVAGRFRAEAERRYQERVRNAFWGFLVPNLICWTIWFATGMDFPWPIFVTIGTAMGWVPLAISKDSVIREIERDLEKKELKRIERQQRRQLPPGS